MALCSRLIGNSCTSSRTLLKLSPYLYTYIPCATMFHEHDPKGGYKKKIKKTKVSLFSEQGRELVKKETNHLIDEWKVALQPNLGVEHHDYEVMWQFNGAESLKDWVVTADKDHNEGATVAYFTPSKGNRGLFHGNLCTDLPQDGKTKRSGYCQIRSPFNYKSFQRQTPYDWMDYTHLIIRCRGDGRAYAINVGMDQYFDVQWHDQYNYALFTRGGPYWQTSKIPFSKFFLTSKGRIQDKQYRILLDKIKFFGISLTDSNDGPFQLEIDYIALVADFNHKETFAYEMYQSPLGHAGT